MGSRHYLAAIRLAACTCVAVAMLSDREAHAGTIIDFESLANAGSGFYPVGSSYGEDGYMLEVIAGFSQEFVTFGVGEVRYGGSAALYNNNASAAGQNVTRLTRDGGGLFDLQSISLAKDARFGDAPVTFTGTFADMTTVQQSFVVTSGTLSAFALSKSFSNLVKVEWDQVTPYHQFDNIVVTAPSVTTVPDSGGTLALMTLALAAIAKGRRWIEDS
jgi:hypothetical protein